MANGNKRGTAQLQSATTFLAVSCSLTVSPKLTGLTFSTGMRFQGASTTVLLLSVILTCVPVVNSAVTAVTIACERHDASVQPLPALPGIDLGRFGDGTQSKASNSEAIIWKCGPWLPFREGSDVTACIVGGTVKLEAFMVS